MGAGIDGEHAHATTEAHPNVKELRVQLTAFDVVPQRLRGIILNAVVGLRCQIRQRIGQCARRTAPRFLREIVRHRLQHGKIKADGLSVRNVGFRRIRGTGEK
ncbi:hypothetical protein SDC9_157603 [bioreactor metagenome]|uniref:Uncharacterized protein n=1 Tax=bioreactor metagenome TaxID=1076179 RepID=A0A645F7G2_9ZZZZ